MCKDEEGTARDTGLRQVLAHLFGIGTGCAACNADRYEEFPFCRRCLARLPFNDGNICEHCGRPTAEPVPACLECKADAPAFYRARSAFRYEGEAVRLIKAFKTGRRYLADAFAYYMAPVLFSQFADADFLVPVPMTEQALARRGYNQALLLARALSGRTGVPVREVAVKTRATAAQKTLSRRERAENLRGSFRIAERKACLGMNVVIVDDVLTTGATSGALAEALLRAGSRKVGVLTAASVSFRMRAASKPKRLER